MADVIQTSQFDPIIPYITGINLSQPATIDCYFPREFEYDGEEMGKYFSDCQIDADYIPPAYVGFTEVRPYQLLGTMFHGTFLDRGIAEYLANKRFGV